MNSIDDRRTTQQPTDVGYPDNKGTYMSPLEYAEKLSKKNRFNSSQKTGDSSNGEKFMSPWEHAEKLSKENKFDLAEKNRSNVILDLSPVDLYSGDPEAKKINYELLNEVDPNFEDVSFAQTVFSNFARGLAGTVTGPIQFAGALTQSKAIKSFARDAESFVNEFTPINPEFEDNWLATHIPRGVGTLAGALIPGGVFTRGASLIYKSATAAKNAGNLLKAAELARKAKRLEQYGKATILTTMGGQEGYDAYTRAINHGDDHLTAVAKSLGYATVAGAIEAGVATKIIGRLGGLYGNKAAKEIVEALPDDALKQPLRKSMIEGTKALGKDTAEGFLEESSQAVAQGLIVEGKADVGEALESGAIGAFVQGPFVGGPRGAVLGTQVHEEIRKRNQRENNSATAAQMLKNEQERQQAAEEAREKAEAALEGTNEEGTPAAAQTPEEIMELYKVMSDEEYIAHRKALPDDTLRGRADELRAEATGRALIFGNLTDEGDGNISIIIPESATPETLKAQRDVVASSDVLPENVQTMLLEQLDAALADKSKTPESSIDITTNVSDQTTKTTETTEQEPPAQPQPDIPQTGSRPETTQGTDARPVGSEDAGTRGERGNLEPDEEAVTPPANVSQKTEKVDTSGEPAPSTNIFPTPKEEQEYYTSRLKDPTLVDQAIPVETPDGTRLAVPLGGDRVSGLLEGSFATEEEAQTVVSQLEGNTGFNRVRAVQNKDGNWVVAWGTGTRQGDSYAASNGRKFGYTDQAIDSFVSTLDPSAKKAPAKVEPAKKIEPEIVVDEVITTQETGLGPGNVAEVDILTPKLTLNNTAGEAIEVNVVKDPDTGGKWKLETSSPEVQQDMPAIFDSRIGAQEWAQRRLQKIAKDRGTPIPDVAQTAKAPDKNKKKGRTAQQINPRLVEQETPEYQENVNRLEPAKNESTRLNPLMQFLDSQVGGNDVTMQNEFWQDEANRERLRNAVGTEFKKRVRIGSFSRNDAQDVYRQIRDYMKGRTQKVDRNAEKRKPKTKTTGTIITSTRSPQGTQPQENATTPVEAKENVGEAPAARERLIKTEDGDLVIPTTVIPNDGETSTEKTPEGKPKVWNKEIPESETPVRRSTITRSHPIKKGREKVALPMTRRTDPETGNSVVEPVFVNDPDIVARQIDLGMYPVVPDSVIDEEDGVAPLHEDIEISYDKDSGQYRVSGARTARYPDLLVTRENELTEHWNNDPIVQRNRDRQIRNNFELPFEKEQNLAKIKKREPHPNEEDLLQKFHEKYGNNLDKVADELDIDLSVAERMYVEARATYQYELRKTGNRRKRSASTVWNHTKKKVLQFVRSRAHMKQGVSLNAPIGEESGATLQDQLPASPDQQETGTPDQQAIESEESVEDQVPELSEMPDGVAELYLEKLQAALVALDPEARARMKTRGEELESLKRDAYEEAIDAVERGEEDAFTWDEYVESPSRGERGRRNAIVSWNENTGRGPARDSVEGIEEAITRELILTSWGVNPNARKQVRGHDVIEAAIKDKRVPMHVRRMLKQLRSLDRTRGNKSKPFTVSLSRSGSADWRGIYELGTGRIRINVSTDIPPNAGEVATVLAHEYAHHLSLRLLQENPDNLTKEERKLVKDIEKLRDAAIEAIYSRRGFDAKYPTKEAFVKSEQEVVGGELYGLQSSHEFLAEVLTNLDFQATLSKIAPVRGISTKTSFESFSNLLQQILTFIAENILGFSSARESLLSQAFITSLDLIQNNQMQGASPTQTDAKAMMWVGTKIAQLEKQMATSHDTALTMEAMNVADMETIYEITGWYRAEHDGQWRYNREDTGAELIYWKSGVITFVDIIMGSTSHTKRTHKSTLNKLLRHPVLYTLYPELGDYRVEIRPQEMMKGNRGTFNRGTKTIQLSDALSLEGSQSIMSTLLHEIQHAVQNIEGFGRGGSGITFSSNIMEGADKNKEVPLSIKAFLLDVLKRGGQEKSLRKQLNDVTDSDLILNLSYGSFDQTKKEYKESFNRFVDWIAANNTENALSFRDLATALNLGGLVIETPGLATVSTNLIKLLNDKYYNRIGGELEATDTARRYAYIMEEASNTSDNPKTVADIVNENYGYLELGLQAKGLPAETIPTPGSEGEPQADLNMADGGNRQSTVEPVSFLQDDAPKQVKWLGEQARQKGYSGLREMTEKNLTEALSLMRQWRANHPQATEDAGLKLPPDAGSNGTPSSATVAAAEKIAVEVKSRIAQEYPSVTVRIEPLSFGGGMQVRSGNEMVLDPFRLIDTIQNTHGDSADIDAFIDIAIDEEIWHIAGVRAISTEDAIRQGKSLARTEQGRKTAERYAGLSATEQEIQDILNDPYVLFHEYSRQLMQRIYRGADTESFYSDSPTSRGFWQAVYQYLKAALTKLQARMERALAPEEMKRKLGLMESEINAIRSMSETIDQDVNKVRLAITKELSPENVQNIIDSISNDIEQLNDIPNFISQNKTKYHLTTPENRRELVVDLLSMEYKILEDLKQLEQNFPDLYRDAAKLVAQLRPRLFILKALDNLGVRLIDSEFLNKQIEYIEEEAKSINTILNPSQAWIFEENNPNDTIRRKVTASIYKVFTKEGIPGGPITLTAKINGSENYLYVSKMMVSDPQYYGISVPLLGSIIQEAQALGLDTIETTAAGSADNKFYTGYKTWVKMGFDFYLTKDEIQITLDDWTKVDPVVWDLLMEHLRTQGPISHLELVNLMPEWQKEWEKYGSQVDVIFDLTPGSLSTLKFADTSTKLSRRWKKLTGTEKQKWANVIEKTARLINTAPPSEGTTLRKPSGNTSFSTPALSQEELDEPEDQIEDQYLVEDVVEDIVWNAITRDIPTELTSSPPEEGELFMSPGGRRVTGPREKAVARRIATLQGMAASLLERFGVKTKVVSRKTIIEEAAAANPNVVFSVETGTIVPEATSESTGSDALDKFAKQIEFEPYSVSDTPYIMYIDALTGRVYVNNERLNEVSPKDLIGEALKLEGANDVDELRVLLKNKRKSLGSPESDNLPIIHLKVTEDNSLEEFLNIPTEELKPLLSTEQLRWMKLPMKAFKKFLPLILEEPMLVTSLMYNRHLTLKHLKLLEPVLQEMDYDKLVRNKSFNREMLDYIGIDKVAEFPIIMQHDFITEKDFEDIIEYNKRRVEIEKKAKPTIDTQDRLRLYLSKYYKNSKHLFGPDFLLKHRDTWDLYDIVMHPGFTADIADRFISEGIEIDWEEMSYTKEMYDRSLFLEYKDLLNPYDVFNVARNVPLEDILDLLPENPLAWDERPIGTGILLAHAPITQEFIDKYFEYLTLDDLETLAENQTFNPDAKQLTKFIERSKELSSEGLSIAPDVVSISAKAIRNLLEHLPLTPEIMTILRKEGWFTFPIRDILRNPTFTPELYKFIPLESEEVKMWASHSFELNKQFLLDNENKLDWEFVVRNPTMTMDLIEEFKHKLDWKTPMSHSVLRNKNITPEFLDNYFKETEKILPPATRKEYLENALNFSPHGQSPSVAIMLRDKLEQLSSVAVHSPRPISAIGLEDGDVRHHFPVFTPHTSRKILQHWLKMWTQNNSTIESAITSPEIAPTNIKENYIREEFAGHVGYKKTAPFTGYSPSDNYSKRTPTNDDAPRKRGILEYKVATREEVTTDPDRVKELIEKRKQKGASSSHDEWLVEHAPQNVAYIKLNDVTTAEGLPEEVVKLNDTFGLPIYGKDFKLLLKQKPAVSWVFSLGRGGAVVNGMYNKVTKQATVSKDAPPETTIHEAFSHPFIEAAKKENRPLYDNLLYEAKTHSGVVAEVNSIYKEFQDQQATDDEYIAHAIDMYVRNELDEIKDKGLISAIRRFFSYISDHLRSILDLDGARVADISPNTTLRELAGLALYGTGTMDLTGGKAAPTGTPRPALSMSAGGRRTPTTTPQQQQKRRYTATAPRAYTSALSRMLHSEMPELWEKAFKDEVYIRGFLDEDKQAARGFVDSVLANGGTLEDVIARLDARRPVFDPSGLTDEQASIVRGIVAMRANNLRQGLIDARKAGKSLNTDLIQYYENLAMDQIRIVQSELSRSGSYLSRVGRALGDMTFPFYAMREYKDPIYTAQKKELDQDQGTEDIKDIIEDSSSEAATKTSTTMKPLVGKAAGVTEPMQQVFDFWYSLAAQFVRGSGLPVTQDIANSVADRMVSAFNQSMKLARKDNAKTRPALDILESEVLKKVRAALSAKLAPHIGMNSMDNSVTEALKRLITDTANIDLVEKAYYEAASELLASPDNGLTAEQIAELQQSVDGREMDLSHLKSAKDVISRAIDLDLIIRRSTRERGMTRSALITMVLGASSNLSRNQAEAMARAIADTYDSMVRKRARQKLENMAKTRGSRVPMSKIDRFLELVNMGAFNEAALYNLIAKNNSKLKLPTWDDAFMEEIRKESARVQTLPQRSDVRHAAAVRLMSKVAHAHAKNLRSGHRIWYNISEVGPAIWQAGVLSGVPTQLVNMFATKANIAFQSFFDAIGYAAAAKKLNLKSNTGSFFADAIVGWLNAVGIGRKGVHTAATESKRALQTGMTRFRNERREALSLLETMNLPHKWVGRFMLAADAFNAATANEIKQRMAFRFAQMTQGRNADQVQAAMRDAFNPSPQLLERIEIAIQDETRQGLLDDPADANLSDAARKRNLKRRQDQRRLELFEQRRFDMVPGLMEESRQTAEEWTYNTDSPKGLSGLLFEGMFNGLNRQARVTKYFLPFMRTLANLLNTTLDFSPLGIARAHGVSLGYFLPESSRFRRVKPDTNTPEGLARFYTQAAKGYMGTAAIMALIAMLIKGIEDEEEGKEPYFTVYGPGPRSAFEREQLRKGSGWQPNTVKIGNIRLRYTDLPVLNLALGGMGVVADSYRFGKANEQDLPERAALWSLGMINIVMERNLLSGVSNLFEIIQNPDQRGVIKTKQLASGLVAGFTNPQILKWMEQTMATDEDGNFTRPDISTTQGWLASMIPFSASSTDPALNVLGDEIKNRWYEPTIRRFGGLDTLDRDPLLAQLIPYNLRIPAPSKLTRIDIPELGEKATLSDSNTLWRTYIKYRGEYLKQALNPRTIRRLQQMETEEAQDFLNYNIGRIARKKAIARIEREVAQGKLKP